MQSGDSSTSIPIPASRGGQATYTTNTSSNTQQQGMEVERPLGAPGGIPGGYGASHGQRTSPLNMGAMSGALPDFQSPTIPYGQQSFSPSGPPTAGMVYQLQQASQFAGQAAANTPTYSLQFPQQYPNMYHQQHQLQQGGQVYPHVLPGSQQQGGVHGQQAFMGQAYFPHQQAQQFPQGYGQQAQLQAIQSRQNPYNQPYGRRSSLSYGQGQFRQDNDPRTMGGVYTVADSGGGAFSSASGAFLQPRVNTDISRQSSGASSVGPSVPRGPPRKPKQSGHALWVGNLPPGTNVMDLKDHFSRDATKDIESVFLISKSNCAFVNYKTDTACAAAMARFHDSRFQGVRLVCRLRRGTASPAAGAPTGPSTSQRHESEERPKSPAAEVRPSSEQEQEQTSPSQAAKDPPKLAPRVKEKFFIVKSLTVEDLELSVRNGIWATQAHNEAALNKAYESAEHVFLIFSANKSGEYFGYARMTSSINEDTASTIELAPRAGTAMNEPDLPNTIPTPATEFAPKGRIIDDSARGTIFWEADPIESEEKDKSGDDSKSEKSVGDDPEDLTAAGNQSFGKPFKIEWVSTDRLPFYRTRGLRNPWNANREVKIARDGTELETGVGRRLVQMFHRPMGGPGSGRPTPQGMQMGYHPTQPY